MTYLNRIIRYFPSDKGHKLYILSNTVFDPSANSAVEYIKIPNWMKNPFLRYLLGAIYFIWFFRKRRCDIIYYPGGSVDFPPPKGAQIVVAFRNMLPFLAREARRFPLGYQRIRMFSLHFIQKNSFKRADLLIFISRFAKEVIDGLLPHRQGSCVVIPHGADRAAMEMAVKAPSDLPARYVAYVSILDSYKAQVEVVRAWAQMRRRLAGGEKLVLVGPSRSYYEKRVRATIRELGVEEDVILYGPVAQNKLYSIYKGAIFNIFASSCENCPNILLEILASDSPVICSKYPPMPEFGGPGIDYFDPYDVDELSSLMETYLTSQERRYRSAKAAAERGKDLSWRNTAEETWQAILSCCHQ